jgi:hypothetical protein
MTPLQRRAFNTYFGGLLLVLGLGAWGIAGYFAAVPRAPAPPKVATVAIDTASCQIALTELGYSVTDRGSEIIVFEPLGSMPREQLEKASIAVTLCRLPLATFCMGEGCSRPGVHLTLRKSDSAQSMANASTSEELPRTPDKKS